MENSRESIIRRIRTSIFEGSDSNKYAVNQPSVSIDSDTIVDSYYTYSQLSESVNQCVSSLRSLRCQYNRHDEKTSGPDLSVSKPGTS